jgi:ABC-type sugar transport system substrate-binding protein
VKTFKIGYAFNAVDENTQRTLTAWQDAVEAWNSSNDEIKVEFFYTDAQSNVETQLSNVETMILEKPDAIVLQSVDTTGCIPAAEAIHNAGIFCVEGRGMVSDAVDLHWTGFDEPSMSRLAATIYSDYLKANPDVVLKAVLIYGNPAQANQLHRMDGFKELAEQYPDNIQILDENYGNWKTDEAQRLMDDWIQLYGHEINVVVSASDAMSLGAINAMQAAGFKPGEVLMTAVDGTTQGLDQVESGWQTATVKMLMSRASVGELDIIIKCLTGEYTENSYNGGSEFTALVTKDNVTEYRTID